MNQQLQISISDGNAQSLDDIAGRIRELVATARFCIVEIGRALLVAKSIRPHGGWLDWLEKEFGWSERTAQNYMQVANAFRTAKIADFTGITIDAGAFMALSAPEVPPEARDDAVASAQAGKRITKAAAEKMIVAATKKAVKEAVDKERGDAEGRLA